MVRSMLGNLPSVTQLAQIIAQVAAPSFLLGAVAAFIAVLVSRLNRVLDRAYLLNAAALDAAGGGSPGTHFGADIPLLVRRARHLNRAILFSTVSAIVTSLLVIVAFVSALLRFQHEYGVAMLFIVALGFFVASLVELVREVLIALHELDYFR
jgi:Protein of unknown function (DUF2721)